MAASSASVSSSNGNNKRMTASTLSSSAPSLTNRSSPQLKLTYTSSSSAGSKHRLNGDQIFHSPTLNSPSSSVPTPSSSPSSSVPFTRSSISSSSHSVNLPRTPTFSNAGRLTLHTGTGNGNGLPGSDSFRSSTHRSLNTPPQRSRTTEQTNTCFKNNLGVSTKSPSSSTTLSRTAKSPLSADSSMVNLPAKRRFESDQHDVIEIGSSEEEEDAKLDSNYPENGSSVRNESKSLLDLPGSRVKCPRSFAPSAHDLAPTSCAHSSASPKSPCHNGAPASASSLHPPDTISVSRFPINLSSSNRASMPVSLPPFVDKPSSIANHRSTHSHSTAATSPIPSSSAITSHSSSSSSSTVWKVPLDVHRSVDHPPSSKRLASMAQPHFELNIGPFDETKRGVRKELQPMPTSITFDLTRSDSDIEIEEGDKGRENSTDARSSRVPVSASSAPSPRRVHVPLRAFLTRLPSKDSVTEGKTKSTTTTNTNQIAPTSTSTARTNANTTTSAIPKTSDSYALESKSFTKPSDYPQQPRRRRHIPELSSQEASDGDVRSEAEAEAVEEAADDDEYDDSDSDVRSSEVGPRHQAEIPRLLTSAERLLDLDRFEDKPMEWTPQTPRLPVPEPGDDEEEYDDEVEIVGESVTKRAGHDKSSLPDSDEPLAQSRRRRGGSIQYEEAEEDEQSPESDVDEQDEEEEKEEYEEEEEEEERQWEVKAILCKRLVPHREARRASSSSHLSRFHPSSTPDPSNGYEYLIAWVGFPSSANSFEPWENVRGVLEGMTHAERNAIPLEAEYKKSLAERRSNRMKRFTSPPVPPSMANSKHAETENEFAEEDDQRWMMHPPTSRPELTNTANRIDAIYNETIITHSSPMDDGDSDGDGASPPPPPPPPSSHPGPIVSLTTTPGDGSSTSISDPPLLTFDAADTCFDVDDAFLFESSARVTDLYPNQESNHQHNQQTHETIHRIQLPQSNDHDHDLDHDQKNEAHMPIQSTVNDDRATQTFMVHH